MGPSLGRRRFCRLLGGLAIGGGASAGGLPYCEAPLGGTFLQPTLADLDRDPAYWRGLLAEFRALGMTQVIVQWLRYGPHSLEPILSPLAAAAAETGIALHLGLAFDPAYWGLLAEPEAELARHLGRWRAASLDVAERALDRCNPAGWYLPEEIDDLAWVGFARRDLLVEHLARSTAGLAHLAPGRPVAISTFIGGRGEREEFLTAWRQVWAAADLTVMVQDGQGVHRLPDDRLRPYLHGIADAARHFRRRWAIVIEMFEQLSGTPLDDAAFSARPAPLSRVARQIALGQAFPEAGRVAFAAREYMLASPAPGEASLAELYRRSYTISR